MKALLSIRIKKTLNRNLVFKAKYNLPVMVPVSLLGKLLPYYRFDGKPDIRSCIIIWSCSIYCSQ